MKKKFMQLMFFFFFLLISVLAFPYEYVIIHGPFIQYIRYGAAVFVLLIVGFQYLYMNGFLRAKDKTESLLNKQKKKIDLPEEVQEQLIQELLYPIQLIHSASQVLNQTSDIEKVVAAGRIIEENVYTIKKQLGLDFSSTQIENLPFVLQTVSIDEELTREISISLFGNNRDNLLKIRLILQAYGFFCRMFSDVDLAYDTICAQTNQFLIILPESDVDPSYELVKKLREKYSILELPVLLMVNKYSNYLIEKNYSLQINDFITSPFGSAEIISRIQSLNYSRKLYIENKELFISEKEKRTFLYFVTHNVNTPLTILMNEIHELYNQDFDDKTMETITMIQQSANEIDGIIQNVLVSFRLSDGRYMMNSKIINLVEVISLVNNYIRSKAIFKQQSFILSAEKPEYAVFCDEYSLRGIYTNLTDNAIKYSPIGGKIQVRIFDDEEFVYLQILDNGVGIPSEKQLVLFNRFANIGSRPTGTEKSIGLGLYVVNEMCKQNNLTLSYSPNSEEETGSCFTVKFNKINDYHFD